MGIWTLITATLIVQEFATSALVLVLAVHSEIPLWPIHVIWAVTTLVDMYFGYQLGLLLKRKLKNNRWVGKIDRWSRDAVDALGDRGVGVALMLLAIVNFPYLNTFIAAWIDAPQNVSILFTTIGNFIWYLLLWGAVLGLTSFVENPSIILLVIVGIGALSHLSFKIFERAQKKNRRK
ncbi:MAG TPA: hypothetical protein VMU07_02560 [Candidatus Paceibacterota bacterium]|nr:hypothetical protein [Candidatus Paceibacterota bacterium]